MPISAEFFSSEDEDTFISSVRCNLDQGAPALHGMSPEDYVRQCRELRNGCGVDEVYKVKILIDKRILAKYSNKSWLPEGFETAYQAPEPPEQIYCVSIAIVGPDGEYVDAPEGYERSKTLPGHHSVLATRKIPKELQDTDDPEPTNYLIAVLDVLGFSKRLKDIGLREMYRLYSDLISVAFTPNVDDPPWRRLVTPIGEGLFVPTLARLPLNHAYFSDTLLIWVPLEPNRVMLFLERLTSVFCAALRLRIPLRGALSIGEAIMHKASNTYLGTPIVEAALLEKAQLWTGLACGVSFNQPPRPIPLPVTNFVVWDTPVKDSKDSALLSGLVVDWPRKWRDLHGTSASEILLDLRTPEFSSYYDNAVKFVAFSDANPEWFLKMPGPTGTKPKDA